MKSINLEGIFNICDGDRAGDLEDRVRVVAWVENRMVVFADFIMRS